MGTDRYGHTYLYRDGHIERGREVSKGAVVSYYFSEADGWTFMRGNTTTTTHLSVGDIGGEDLEKLLADVKINEEVRTRLKGMIARGEFKSGNYSWED